jgi:hypothetical protein
VELLEVMNSVAATRRQKKPHGRFNYLAGFAGDKSCHWPLIP